MCRNEDDCKDICSTKRVDMEDRITELEIRLTHIEDTLDILNKTVIEQHSLIDQLQMQISILDKKLKAAAASNIALESEETPPPHY
jgi:SlyX protein